MLSLAYFIFIYLGKPEIKPKPFVRRRQIQDLYLLNQRVTVSRVLIGSHSPAYPWLFPILKGESIGHPVSRTLRKTQVLATVEVTKPTRRRRNLAHRAGVKW